MSNKKDERFGLKKLNKYNDTMKIVEYNNAMDIVVEFQDKYKAKVHTSYSHFLSGEVKNQYYPNVFGVGMIGDKYLSRENYKMTKEYMAWSGMMQRCFDDKTKIKYPTYKDVTCCEEWLLFDNFYEWLHSQENFKQWYNNDGWHLDKDILVKGNRIYSPETCCLVPPNVNSLFVKKNANRGDLPIGVSKNGNGFMASCMNPLTKKHERLGTYRIPEKAFLSYKKYKEDLIKKIADIEYFNGNIIKACRDVMMKYEVEITD